MVTAGTALLVVSLLVAGVVLSWIGYSLRYRQRLSLLVAHRRGRLTTEAGETLARFVGAWTIAYGVVVAALGGIVVFSDPTAVWVPFVACSGIYVAGVIAWERRHVE